MLTRTTIVLAFLAKPFLVCNPQPTPAVTGEGSSSSESTDTTDPTDTMTDPTLTMTDPSSSTTTVEPMCGNGMQEGDEECDDGNDDPADACLNNCKNAACGDDQVRADDMPEECDDGDQIDTNDCTAACKIAKCGDSIVWEGKEECDDGNDVNDDDCTNDCKLPVCGDGMKTGREECDDGANNVPKEEASAEQCTTECMVACADGTQSSMEECDDGNLEANDGCSPTCADEFIMFVTAASYTGNLGGVAGADTICQTDAAGKLTGTYVAWISATGDDAKIDIPDGKPMIRPDGMLIVADAKALHDNGGSPTLMSSVSIDVDGNPVTGYAWTGTVPAGIYAGLGCTEWTVNDMDSGMAGSVEAQDSKWTVDGNANFSCSSMYHLYCFRKLDL